MPAPALNGYALTNYFRKLRLREPFSPLEAYLFFELVAICNDEGWPAEFSASNGVLQAALGCSEQGLIKARQRLEKAGLIAFVSGNRRTPTSYQFTGQGSTEFSHSSPKGSTEGSTQFSQPAAKGSTQDSTEFSHSGTESTDGSTQGSTEGSTEFSPYKEQTKTKRKNSSITSKSEVAASIPFEAFWEAYGKKVGRHKTAERWKQLTADEQAAALAHAPLFAAATPDKQFRKDPLTYLNGKCWLDEELPAPRNGAAAQPVPAPAAPLPAPKLNAAFLAQQTAAAEEAEDAHFARFAVA
ncbi:MAG: hypothetical protein ACRYFZ_28175 [Janthinobacterium lividum]